MILCCTSGVSPGIQTASRLVVASTADLTMNFGTTKRTAPRTISRVLRGITQKIFSTNFRTQADGCASCRLGLSSESKIARSNFLQQPAVSD